MAYQINAQVFGEGDYEGMPDVIVTEVGTTKSAKTNQNGNFSLSASSASAMIRFQMLGFKEKVVKASEIQSFVNLDSETQILDEIDVFGGGSKNNTMLYVLLACGTILLTASIVSAKNKRPQKVQIR